MNVYNWLTEKEAKTMTFDAQYKLALARKENSDFLRRLAVAVVVFALALAVVFVALAWIAVILW